MASARGFADLRPRAGRVVAVDDSLRLAPTDTSDHLARIDQAGKYEASLWAAVMRARKLVEKAYRRLPEGVDPADYPIEQNAWMVVEEEAPPDKIEADRLEGREFVLENEHVAADLMAVEASYDLARDILDLIAELRKTGPDASSDFAERFTATETLAEAEAMQARALDRYVTAKALRGLLATYGRTVREHLALFPEDERDTEEEALRDLVFGT